MRRVKIEYRRRYVNVVILNFNGVELVRELEPDAEQCSFCGTEREERTTAFFSYDDHAEAFCNLRCYGAYLASGRQTASSLTKVRKALELLAYIEAQEAADELADRRRRKAATAA